ncbi:MAG TPA: ribosomal-processing cysteine protease Prp [Candidatus Limnocylindria bacterium]|nr:ribosomal-processing cysteine protease Prp [Candidatus Limnocylindria bacterium]
MTRIRLLALPDGRLCGFEVTGHAGAGAYGQDIVCAAVSFLATTCANALEGVAGAKPEAEAREGCLRAVVAGENLNVKAQAILETFRQGALDLVKNYPRHVRLQMAHHQKERKPC